MMTLELNILDWIQTLHTSFGDSLMIFFTNLGNRGFIWIALDIVLLIFPKTRRIGIAVAFALILELILCNGVLKPLFERTRPFDINTDIDLLISPPSDFSFPSGHTASGFAAASALCFAKSRLRFPALILAALIAFSRLYLYVHFPSDVLAGILLGVLTGAAGTLLGRRVIPS